MKLLIIGAGSIGSRHAGNAGTVAQAAIFDIDAARAADVAAKSGLRHFAGLEEALAWRPDGVIVATPHMFHIEYARKAVQAGAHVLIEKPVSHSLDGVEDFLQMAEGARRQVFVVCNMRYHPAVQALKAHLPDIGKPLFCRAHFGNYLPNMRPNADYRALYCAQKKQGGGVVLDGIHELDYLSWLLGPYTAVTCEAGKISDLDIDVEDYAAMALRHRSGTRTEIHSDYLQQFKRRGCEIAGTEGTLLWQSDGKNPEHCVVRRYLAKSGKWDILLEDLEIDIARPYQLLLEDFVKSISSDTNKIQLHTGREAQQVLTAALAAHRSAREGRRIEL